MTSAEIKTMRERYLASIDETKIGGLDSFWLSEMALQVAYVCELLEKLLTHGKTHKVKAAKDPRLPKVRVRKYYAVEYLPSLPVHLDRVTCEKPKERWHHEVSATSSDDARNKLVARLTKEREAEQERYANTDNADLDKKAS